MVPSESPLVTRHSSSSGTEAPRSRRPAPAPRYRYSVQVPKSLPEGVYRLTSQAGDPRGNIVHPSRGQRPGRVKPSRGGWRRCLPDLMRCRFQSPVWRQFQVFEM